MAEAHHHHYHANAFPSDGARNIRAAFFLNLGFALLEIAGGILTNSVAILSDAVHDLGDSLTLGLSWYLEQRSREAGTARFSYGMGRLSLMAALMSSIILIAGSVLVLSEAVPRLMNPVHTDAAGMIIFALIGIAVNGAAALRVSRGRSVHERVISWHFIEDVLGWVAVLVAGIIIRFRDIHILDPVLSILIVLYILRNVFRTVGKTVALFLQGVPDGFDITHVEESLRRLPDVVGAHDTHVWTLDGASHVLTTHLVAREGASRADEETIKAAARRLLLDHGIVHSTIEVEPCGQDCEPSELHRRWADDVPRPTAKSG
jgi:cobalt-zinc-cadmium efflux system protein